VGRGPLSPPVLALRDLACRPRGAAAPVLQGVTLDVPGGTTLVLLGGNGAGKSTLLRVAAGLLPAEAGEVVRDGDPVRGFDATAVALVTEDPRRQFVAPTVAGEIAFALESRLTDVEQIARRTAEALAEFALESLGDRDPLHLSAGEQQIALLAAALAPGPRLLLLDDPFAYLDPGTARECWSRVERLVARGRIAAAVLATHDVELAAEAGAAAVLHEGRLAAWGPPEFVLRGPLPPGLGVPLAVRVERSLENGGRALVPGSVDAGSLAARVAWSSLPGPGASC